MKTKIANEITDKLHRLATICTKPRIAIQGSIAVQLSDKSQFCIDVIKEKLWSVTMPNGIQREYSIQLLSQPSDLAKSLVESDVLNALNKQ